MITEPEERRDIGLTNFTLDLSPGSIAIDFEDKIHIITPLEQDGFLHQHNLGAHRYRYNCIVFPVIGETFSAKEFPQSIPEDLAQRIDKIAESLVKICFDEREYDIADITFDLTYNKKEYTLSFEFEDIFAQL